MGGVPRGPGHVSRGPLPPVRLHEHPLLLGDDERPEGNPVDPHHPDQERRGRVPPSRRPALRRARVADELRLDDGALADLREPGERGDDGALRRRDPAACLRRVRVPGRRHDARRRPEARTGVESREDDGRPRLDPDPAVQLDRGTVDARGDAVPHVPRGIRAGHRVLRRHGDWRGIHHGDRRAAVRPVDLHDRGDGPRLRHPRRRPALGPRSVGLSNELLNYDHDREYYAGLPMGPHGERLRRHGDRLERLPGGYYRHQGRIDDMININGVKTSAEEIRSVIGSDIVYDSKPIAVDTDGTGQHRLVIYAVPRDSKLVESDELREKLRGEFQKAIKENLNPLLGHVEDVVLVPELPQAGPGKTRTMADLRLDYLARIGKG